MSRVLWSVINSPFASPSDLFIKYLKCRWWIRNIAHFNVNDATTTHDGFYFLLNFSATIVRQDVHLKSSTKAVQLWKCFLLTKRRENLFVSRRGDEVFHLYERIEQRAIQVKWNGESFILEWHELCNFYTKNRNMKVTVAFDSPTHAGNFNFLPFPFCFDCCSVCSRKSTRWTLLKWSCSVCLLVFSDIQESLQ